MNIYELEKILIDLYSQEVRDEELIAYYEKEYVKAVKSINLFN